MMARAEPTYRIHTDAAWRNVEGHIFIITPDNRQHELVGDVEGAIWAACDEAPQTLTDLLAVVCTEFAVAPEQASVDLREFLETAVARGLIAIS